MCENVSTHFGQQFCVSVTKIVLISKMCACVCVCVILLHTSCNTTNATGDHR